MLKKKELERLKEQKKQEADRQLKFAECIENAEDVETRSISKYSRIWNLLLLFIKAGQLSHNILNRITFYNMDQQ